MPVQVAVVHSPFVHVPALIAAHWAFVVHPHVPSVAPLHDHFASPQSAPAKQVCVVHVPFVLMLQVDPKPQGSFAVHVAGLPVTRSDVET